MKMKAHWSGLIFLTLVTATPASAALYDRGNGLIYDDLLDITWMQDANYAETSGYSTDGKMQWGAATSWAAALSYGGYDDWRLPTVSPINGTSWLYWSTRDGSTDFGHNISAPGSVHPGSTASELSHMFYTTLGNLGAFDTNGDPQAGSGVTQTGPFINLQATNAQGAIFWTDTIYQTYPNYALIVDYSDGFQKTSPQTNGSYEHQAWLVRDGDVIAPVPVPAAVWLFGSALFGLLGFSSRRSIA